MDLIEHELIADAREELDDNAVTFAVKAIRELVSIPDDQAFNVQTILEDLFQNGIAIGETVGETKALLELMKTHNQKG